MCIKDRGYPWPEGWLRSPPRDTQNTQHKITKSYTHPTSTKASWPLRETGNAERESPTNHAYSYDVTTQTISEQPIVSYVEYMTSYSIMY